MIMKRGPYKRYNADPSVPLPKATAWITREEIVKQILNIPLSNGNEGICTCSTISN